MKQFSNSPRWQLSRAVASQSWLRSASQISAPKEFHLINEGDSEKFRAAIYDDSSGIFLTKQNVRLFSGRAGKLDAEMQGFSLFFDVYKIPQNYSNFPSKEWNKFLENLDQNLVQNLQLQNPAQRFLISHYNDLIADPQTLQERSKAIGDIPLARLFFREPCFNEDVQEVLRKKKAVENIDQKMSAFGALHHYFNQENWATANLFKVLKLGTDLSRVENIAKCYAHGLSQNGQFDATAFDSRLRNITPQALPHMWQVSYDVMNAYDDERIRSQLLTSVSPQNWHRNVIDFGSGPSAILRENYLKSITCDIVLPAFYRELCGAFGCQEKDLPQHLKEEYYVEHVTKKLMAHVLEKITQQPITPAQLMGYVNRHERNFVHVDKVKPQIVEELQESNQERRGQWQALIGEHEIAGCKFRVLTRQSELIEEGKMSDNCVSGYWHQCFRGESHIISGTNLLDGERFSIKVIKANGRYFTTLGDNEDVIFSPQAIRAVEELEIAINEKKIPVNEKSGSVTGKKDLKGHLGFDPFDQE